MAAAAIPRSITARVVLLVTISTVVQCAVLVAAPKQLDAGTTGRHLFSTLEMALVVALAVLGWRILRWARAEQSDPLVRRAAELCFASLVLCAVGDLINRNYLEQSFQWDDVVRHSYLITSIWAFLPGYAVVVWANRTVTRHAVPARAAAVTVGAAAVVGVVAFAGNRVSGMGAYPSAMVLAYTVVLTVLAASTIWLIRTFGWEASIVPVLGCLLAVVADLLIGTWWIAEDRYPVVEHANWIIYFASLAMIQQLPSVVATRRRA
jgi:Mn2+/Fe2+ NRAMP family transporter